MAANRVENITKKESDRAAEITMNRIILMFIVATAAIVYLVTIGRVTVGEMTELFNNRLNGVIPAAVSVILFIGAAVFFCIRRSSRTVERDKSLNSYNALFFAALLVWTTLPSWYFYRAPEVTELLLVTVIAVTILYFVYYLYQREFFVYSTLTAAGACLIFLGDSLPLQIAVLVVGVLSAVTGATLLAGKGELKLGGRSMRIAPYNERFITFFVLAAVTLAAGAVLILSGYVLYVLIGFFALYIAMGIYYTIKLI